MIHSLSMAEIVKSWKTLFVRNLPYSTTNEQLEQLFSDFGPIKRCFVIKNKGKANVGGSYTFAPNNHRLSQ